jgi:hypothetical protein
MILTKTTSLLLQRHKVQNLFQMTQKSILGREEWRTARKIVNGKQAMKGA